MNLPLPLEQHHKIQQIIRSCGQQGHQLASESFQVFEKGKGDYVTNIDRLLDEKLTAAFTTLFPEDGVITEENAASRQALWQGYDRLWLIDPLDGTEDFIQGKSEYAVMVGLLQAEQPRAGWLYVPATDQMYFGGPDWGVFQTVGENPPTSIVLVEPAPPTAQFCPVIIGVKDQRNYGAAIAQFLPAVQFSSVGSFGLKVMEVVCGRAGLYLYCNGRVKLWDTIGPLAIAHAAGLICCDLTGEPLHFSKEALHPETLAHRQTIVIGWPSYVEALRPKIAEAVASVTPQ